jgi:hypothetical protein
MSQTWRFKGVKGKSKWTADPVPRAAPGHSLGQNTYSSYYILMSNALKETGKGEESQRA